MSLSLPHGTRTVGAGFIAARAWYQAVRVTRNAGGDKPRPYVKREGMDP